MRQQLRLICSATYIARYLLLSSASDETKQCCHAVCDQKSQRVERVRCGRGFVFDFSQLALANRLHRLDAAVHDPGAAKAFEPEHRAEMVGRTGTQANHDDALGRLPGDQNDRAVLAHGARGEQEATCLRRSSPPAEHKAFHEGVRKEPLSERLAERHGRAPM